MAYRAWYKDEHGQQRAEDGRTARSAATKADKAAPPFPGYREDVAKRVGEVWEYVGRVVDFAPGGRDH